MAIKVRSELFHTAGTMTEKFKQHLDIIWNMRPSQQAALLKSMPAIVTAKTERAEMVAREIAVKSIGGDKQHAIEATNVLKYIYTQWSPKRDKVRGVLADIEALHVIPKKSGERRKAMAFLTKYLDFLARDSGRRLSRGIAASILPNITDMNTRVDHRAVILSEFDWHADNPDTYRPVCDRTVPVALIRIKLDEGKPIVFQCEADELEMMVRQLKATIKDMEASLRLIRRA